MKRLRHTITAALTGFAVAFGASVSAVPAAVAAPGTPNIVTKAEFNRVRQGMKRWEVQREFGPNTVKGSTRNSPVTQDRAYRTRGEGFSSPVHGVWVRYRKVNGRWQVTNWSAKWWGLWNNRTATGARVTTAKFRNVRNGMSMKDVHDSFGTRGVQYMIDTNGSRGEQIRMYRDTTNNRNAGYGIRYTRVNGTWQVADKGASQSFLTG